MIKEMHVDIETTGFSREWDFILEIAAIIYDSETDKELTRFHEYIKPGKTISKKITDITGITNDQVKNCRNEFEVLTDYIEWVFINKPDVEIGHNVKTFDHQFFARKCEKYRITMYDIEIIDTLKLARQMSKDGKIKVANHKQPTIAQYFNIDYQAHSAIEDILANRKMYKKMTVETGVKSKRKELGF